MVVIVFFACRNEDGEAKKRKNRTESSTSTAISNDTIVGDTRQSDTPLVLSSSQATDGNNLNAQKDDSQIADDIVTLKTSTDVKNDDRRHSGNIEKNILQVEWLTNPVNKNDIKKFTYNKSIERKKESLKRIPKMRLR